MQALTKEYAYVKKLTAKLVKIFFEKRLGTVLILKINVLVRLWNRFGTVLDPFWNRFETVLANGFVP